MMLLDACSSSWALIFTNVVSPVIVTHVGFNFCPLYFRTAAHLPHNVAFYTPIFQTISPHNHVCLIMFDSAYYTFPAHLSRPLTLQFLRLSPTTARSLYTTCLSSSSFPLAPHPYTLLALIYARADQLADPDIWDDPKDVQLKGIGISKELIETLTDPRVAGIAETETLELGV